MDSGGWSVGVEHLDRPFELNEQRATLAVHGLAGCDLDPALADTVLLDIPTVLSVEAHADVIRHAGPVVVGTARVGRKTIRQGRPVGCGGIGRVHLPIVLQVLLTLALGAVDARADVSELRVRRNQVAPRGEVVLETASYYAASPRREGGLDRVPSGLLEVAYGVAPHWELGIRMPWSHADGSPDRADRLQFAGWSTELRYVAPHSGEGGYWGFETEWGRSEEGRKRELLGILGWRAGAWHATLNPVLSQQGAGPTARAERGLNTRLSWADGAQREWGVEVFSTGERRLWLIGRDAPAWWGRWGIAAGGLRQHGREGWIVRLLWGLDDD